MRALIVCLALLAVAATAEADLVSRKTGGAVDWQGDGGGIGDASDSCLSPSPALTVPVASNGLVIPVIDVQDNYALRVPGATPAGFDVRVNVWPTPGVTAAEYLDLNVYVWRPGAGGCGTLLAVGNGPTGFEDVTFTAYDPGPYVVQVVLAGVHAPTTCLDPQCANDAAERASCYPGCRQANDLLGYGVKAAKFA